MAYSFVEIEKDKTTTIGFVFLIFFYFLAAFAIYFLLKFFWAMDHSIDGPPIPRAFISVYEILSVFCMALIVGSAHWFVTTDNLIQKIFKALNAGPLNPKDAYHQMRQNIIEVPVSRDKNGAYVLHMAVPSGDGQVRFLRFPMV